MVAPITWRNVTAPDFSDSNKLRESSVAGLQRGLEGLAGLAKTVDTENIKSATDSALASLNNFRTPEEFQAARSSGALDNLIGQGGDDATISSAINSKLGQLQTDVTRQNQFNVSQQSTKNQADLTSGLNVINNLASADVSSVGDTIASLKASPEFIQSSPTIQNQLIDRLKTSVDNQILPGENLTRGQKIAESKVRADVSQQFGYATEVTELEQNRDLAISKVPTTKGQFAIETLLSGESGTAVNAVNQYVNSTRGTDNDLTEGTISIFGTDKKTDASGVDAQNFLKDIANKRYDDPTKPNKGTLIVPAEIMQLALDNATILPDDSFLTGNASINTKAISEAVDALMAEYQNDIKNAEESRNIFNAFKNDKAKLDKKLFDQTSLRFNNERRNKK